MGLTIHYTLQADVRNPNEARGLIEQLHRKARDLPFAEVGEIVEFGGDACDFQQAADFPTRWLLVQARRMIDLGEETYRLLRPNRVIAFRTWPGEGCEAANFGLANYPETVETENGSLATEFRGWSWESFCKTQYASDPNSGGVENFVRCHLLIVRFLDHAKALGLLGTVKDEGHFWENRDVKALVETVFQWNQHVAAIVGRLKDATSADFQAPIAEFPNFEHLEAEGRKGEDDD